MTVAHNRRFDLAFFLPLILILIAPTLLLWRVVFFGDVFLPADLLRDVAPWRDPAHSVPWNPLMWDGMAEFYPWRFFYAQTVHQGYLALWNPHQFCGTPFLANAQSAVLYPFNLLFVVLPVVRAFGVSVWLHLALTGLFLYGFLRSSAIGASRQAATVGAIAWQLSTWQTAWLALPTFLCVSCWIPSALWFTYRLIQRPSPLRAAALGFVLGLMVLAGHLQIALYGLGLTVTYALRLAVPLVRKDQSRRKPLLAMFALALTLTAGLAAPQILPTLELSRVSHRSGAARTWSSYKGYTSLAIPAISLLTLYVPGVFGNPTEGTYWGIGTNGGPGAYVENACYVGILTLGLAFLGLIVTWRASPTARFFAIAALLALLLALGTPLNALLYFGLPGFAQSGSPGRVLVLWTFCAAVLAAMGTDALLRATRRQAAMTAAVFIGLLITLVAYTCYWVVDNAPAGTLQSNLAREGDLWRLPLGILLGAGIFYGLWRRGTFSANAFQMSLALLVLTDLLAANLNYNRTCRSKDVYPTTPEIAFLQKQAGHDRIMPINRRWNLYGAPPAILPPNSATVYGLYDTQGYDSLLTRSYIGWVSVLNAAPPTPPENGNMIFTNGYGSPLTKQAAVRYIVAQGPLPKAVDLTLAFQNGDVCIYENPQIKPRARSNQGAATITEDSVPTRLSIQSSESRQSLIIADQWYPGWQTQVNNGKWKPTQRAEEVFRSVPTGETTRGPITAKMRYWPSAFRLGLYAFLLTLATITGLTCYHKNPLRRRGGNG